MTDHTGPRDRVRIPEALAKIIAAYAHGAGEIPRLDLAPVRHLSGFQGTSTDGPCGSIAAADGGEATLLLNGQLESRDGDTLEAELMDGSTIRWEHVIFTKEETSDSLKKVSSIF